MTPTAPMLWGVSDLHLGYRVNREALEDLRPRPRDWLIVAGDVGEREEHLIFAWRVLTRRFAKVIWVPGNHELWTVPRHETLRGVAKYDRLVAGCRAYGVVTPEDPWPRLPWDERVVVAPLWLGYDYTFAPDGIDPADAVAWASEERVRCRDEELLHADPYPGIAQWCAARCDAAEARLGALDGEDRVILVNHFPLRRDLVRLHLVTRLPLSRFIVWCGTRRTEDWHRRFPIRVVVSGHLHMRATDWRDGVRFEEVSLGYPRHWRRELGVEGYLRPVWPGPAAPARHAGPFWHR